MKSFDLQMTFPSTATSKFRVPSITSTYDNGFDVTITGVKLLSLKIAEKSSFRRKLITANDVQTLISK